VYRLEFDAAFAKLLWPAVQRLNAAGDVGVQAVLMPTFDSVVALLDHYVAESRATSRTASGGVASRQHSSCVFVDRTGRRDLPVVLATPYRRRPARLTHLCRLAINSALAGRDPDRLWLVPSLRDYLRQHPFSV